MAFTSIIPGTKRWKKAKRKEIGAQLMAQIIKFHGLQSMDQEQKLELLKSFRAAEKMFQEISVWQKTSGFYLTVMLFILCVFGTYLYLNKHVSAPISFLNWLEVVISSFFGVIGFVFGGSILFSLLFGPLLPMINLAPKRIRDYLENSPLVTTAWIAMIALYVYFIAHDGGSSASSHVQEADKVAPAFYGSGIIIALSFIYLRGMVARPTKWAIRRLTFNYYPDAVLVDLSLELLCLVERRYYQRDNVILDRDLAVKIEQLAANIENNLAQRLHTRDTLTCQWAQTSTAEIANSLRETKKYLLLPSHDSLGQLSGYLSRFFVTMVDHNFPQLERKLCDSPGKITPWPIKYLKTILICFIPAALIFLETQTNIFKTPKSMHDNLNLAALLWVITNIAFLFDPAYERKIGSIKDFLK